MGKKKDKKKELRAANKTEYVTGTGQKLWRVHPSDKCAGDHCVIHNPSDHPMKEFKTHWRSDRGLMERICSHGVGHPDPDALAIMSVEDRVWEGVHGCDGCCVGSYNTPKPKLEPCFNCGDCHDCAYCMPADYYEDDEEFEDLLAALFEGTNRRVPTLNGYLLDEIDPDWVDQDAEPNGIGPVCKYCQNLIDWDPTDHALGCARWGTNGGTV